MRIQLPLALFLQFALAQVAWAQLDDRLLNQVKTWKTGDPPPARLLKFPDGKIDQMPVCGMRVLGSEVSDYILEVSDSELLGALLLDDRAEPDTLRAAASRLITLKGTDYVAGLLAAKAQGLLRTELAVLSELLRNPYLAIQVARIKTSDLSLSAAEAVLNEFRADLEAGAPWSEAYRKAADRNPDLADRARDPQSSRTMVSYLYYGVISPSRFDVVKYAIAGDLPAAHVDELFRVRRGTHVLKTDGAVYLYHIKVGEK
jgi:hypothetical protein